MDRFGSMRVFVNVAKLRSFSEAARRLQLSPSVVTRAVAQLEDELGLTLLLRTTRSLRLTERGELYLQSCQRILEDIDGAERQVRGKDAAPRGTLKVAAPFVFGRLHVLPIVNGVLRDYREVAVELTLSDRNVHLVEEGVDVAVRIGELADSSLIAVKVGVVSRIVVASPAYLQKRGVPRSPAELAAHDIIAFEGIGVADEWRFQGGGRSVRLEPRLMVNSIDASIAAAESDIGITRPLSYQVQASVVAGRLTPILQHFAPPPLPVNVIYSARRIASANIAAFVKTARAYFNAHPLVPVEKWGQGTTRKPIAKYGVRSPRTNGAMSRRSPRR